MGEVYISRFEHAQTIKIAPYSERSYCMCRKCLSHGKFDSTALGVIK
jgi:hypothetical protein